MKKIQVTDNFIKHAKEYAEDILGYNQCFGGNKETKTELRRFIKMGGDNEDVSVSEIAVEHLHYLIDKCEECSLPLPEIFPWYGGDGAQAEWEYKNDWYIEIDSSSKGITGLFLKYRENEGYEDGISCDFKSIKDGFLLVKVFLESVVKCNG